MGLLLAAILIGPSPTFGQNGSVGVAYPASGIAIDGDLGDWPEGATRYPIERIEFGDKLGSPDDLKAQFRIAFNAKEHALYVAVEVIDDSIVLDGPGEAVWNTQDGCELFIDALHSVSGSSFQQYARYGGQNRVVGAQEGLEKKMKVAVTRADSRIVYEWRIEFDADLDPDRVIGFDISVADKDQDGSFSWAAWGSGTQKVDTPDRCGEVLLVSPETRFGEVTGGVAWKDPSDSALPLHVRIQSSRNPAFWRNAKVDTAGTYRAKNLPEGPYTIRPVDSANLRIEESPAVEVRVEADGLARADLLHVTPVPWPGMIGDKGVLRNSEAFNQDDLDRFVKAYLAYFKTPGISIAVIKDNKVVYQRGFGLKNAITGEPVTDDTIFEAASMTKPVFAYTVLRLVDRGVLDLDTPLYTYLPYEDISHDDRYKLITARMVLTHRTGFPNWRTGKLEIKFTPGTEVSYSGEGFVYLGKVVEKLTGKKLVDLCREEVFAPLGIEHASLVYNDEVERLTAIGHAGASPLPKWKLQEPNMAASLHINAGNYAKFLIAVLQGKGLSEATGHEMLRPQVKVPDDQHASWGLGIAIEETPQGINYGHGGRNTGFTSHSLLYKDPGIGYVFLVNNDDAPKFDNVLNAYLIAGKSGLKNTRPVAHKLAKIDPTLFDAYVGRYEIGKAAILEITREGDHLMSQAEGDGKMELFPESETVFLLSPTSDATATFVKDDRGKVTHIDLHRDGRDAKASRIKDEPAARESRSIE
ncbi:serine hydrolase [Tundrisphaera lichenicola]|uniref:serine hydrolase n=1 Tax=Tundrisphaera lichenicola TaxID=2029860 RepID=UPI003EBD4907